MNVFVYFSGHGVPDPASREPFLLPFDGDPNQAETGYRLDTLYRNLELVKRKVGQNRHVFVMIDACFTGETGRKGGESLLRSRRRGLYRRGRTAAVTLKTDKPVPVIRLIHVLRPDLTRLGVT